MLRTSQSYVIVLYNTIVCIGHLVLYGSIVLAEEYMLQINSKILLVVITTISVNLKTGIFFNTLNVKCEHGL